MKLCKNDRKCVKTLETEEKNSLKSFGKKEEDLKKTNTIFDSMNLKIVKGQRATIILILFVILVLFFQIPVQHVNFDVNNHQLGEPVFIDNKITLSDFLFLKSYTDGINEIIIKDNSTNKLIKKVRVADSNVDIYWLKWTNKHDCISIRSVLNSNPLTNYEETCLIENDRR